jgi:hypothetical protein
MYLASGVHSSELDLLKPVTDGGFYLKDGKKYECGLYPGGKNDIPEKHRAAGERISASIVPLNASGTPDRNGTVMIATVGHSNPQTYFGGFTKQLKAGMQRGEFNSKLMLSNCCYSGRMCQDWAELCATGDLKVPKSTQVLFLLTSYHGSSRAWTDNKWPDLKKMTSEQRINAMKADLKRILHGLIKHCPELKIAYLGSDTWRGNTGLEPEVYEEAFAFKSLIADQINGDKDLAFDGPARKAPWLCWGAYIWQNSPSKDLFVADGVHPSEAGCQFVVDRWFKSLQANSTTKSWLLQAK